MKSGTNRCMYLPLESLVRTELVEMTISRRSTRDTFFRSDDDKDSNLLAVSWILKKLIALTGFVWLRAGSCCELLCLL